MASLRSFFAFLPFAVALVSFASVARAESAPAPLRCRETLLPKTGTTAPANLPASVVDQNANSPGVTSTILAEELTIDAIPSKLVAIPDSKVPRVTLLIPTVSDPAAGTTYSLSYAVRCSVAQPNDELRRGTSFRAGPAVTLPTRIGDVRELADGTAVITATSELRAFLQTTRFHVLVDDKELSSTRYGTLLDSAEIIVTGWSYGIGLAPGGPTVMSSMVTAASSALLGPHEQSTR